jgi:DNA invertase Pin-like site-specific DNA recombinase
MIHQIRPGYWNEMRRLQKEGFRKAKERGVKLGRKRSYTPQQADTVMEMRTTGDGYGTIASAMGMTKSMVRRIINVMECEFK